LLDRYVQSHQLDYSIFVQSSLFESLSIFNLAGDALNQSCAGLEPVSFVENTMDLSELQKQKYSGYNKALARGGGRTYEEEEDEEEPQWLVDAPKDKDEE
jgi:hypothetical protein